VRTSSGTVRVRGAVDDAEFTAVGGEVRWEGRVEGRARLETVTGRVTFAGTVAPGAALAVDTHAGDVALTLPPGGAALDLLTLRGRVAGPSAVRASARAVGSGAVRGEAVRTTAAAGAGRVEVRTFRGLVRVAAP
jgi:hypothetical protein